MDTFNAVIDIIFNIALISIVPLAIATAVMWWFMCPPRRRRPKTKPSDDKVLARLINHKTALDAEMLDAAATMLRYTEEVDGDG